MDPDRFLGNHTEVAGLLGIAKKFADRHGVPAERQAALRAAGLDPSSLQSYADPLSFALQLVASFRQYAVSDAQVDYHPMIQLLRYLEMIEVPARPYGLDDEELALAAALIARGEENFLALATRRSVGRVEADKSAPIGTGTLVGADLVLTCAHVLSKSAAEHAGVRFGYKTRPDGRSVAQGTSYPLDLANPLELDAQRDFALLRVAETPARPSLRPRNVFLSRDEPLRLVHYPGGQPVVVSEMGRIAQSGPDYVDHPIPTADGSSGAPLFNQGWELVAIHRGTPGLGRRVAPGTTAALPISAIWEAIEPYV